MTLSTPPTPVPKVTPGATMHEQFDIVRPQPAAHPTTRSAGQSRFKERFSMVVAEYPPSSPEARRELRPEPRQTKVEPPKVSSPKKRSRVGHIVFYFENMTKKILEPVLESAPASPGVSKPLPPLPPQSECQLRRNQWGRPRRPQAARVREWEKVYLPPSEHQDLFQDTAQRAKQIDLGHVPGGSADDYFRPQKAPEMFTIKRKPVPPRNDPPQIRAAESSYSQWVDDPATSGIRKGKVAELRLSLGAPFSVLLD